MTTEETRMVTRGDVIGRHDGEGPGGLKDLLHLGIVDAVR